MSNKNLKFFDSGVDTDITEEQIRKLDFEENMNDLINNQKDIIEGHINVERLRKEIMEKL